MKRVIIDCDTGIDDSIAILYALKSKNLHVEGITTGFGNTSSLQATENTLRLIKLANCGYEVPVAMGAECSLNGDMEPAPAHIHGDNGIGNVELPISDQQILSEKAWDFIIRKADELQGELTIITLGRLTNLAKALEKDPKLPQKVKNVVVMGGTLMVPGNVSPYAEANICGDALASDIVVKAGFHMTLVGLDVTMNTFITGQDIAFIQDHCMKENKEIVKYIQSALTFYFKFHYDSLGLRESSVVHDPLAVIVAEDPTIAEYRMIRASVEHESKEFNGMIKIDERFESMYTHGEILYCTKVNSDLAVGRLLSAF